MWDLGGHPVNVELLFREISNIIGDSLQVWNPIEDIKSYKTISKFFQELKSFYETGIGRYDSDYESDGETVDFFHNVAVRGFNISDAWTVSQDLSSRMVKKAKGTGTIDKLKGPSASFFRTAARVLNPNPISKPKFNTYTSLDWLSYHVSEEGGGVENVFLWLGANNALAAVTNMKIKQTPGNLELLPKISTDMNDNKREKLYAEYEKLNPVDKPNEYNLWHIDDFAKEYEQLLTYVDEILENKTTKVFVATVPFVTILPLARGMGKEFEIDKRRYFEYYTYFPFEDDKLIDNPQLPALRLSEILFIEQTIKQYNDTIKKKVAEHNSQLQQPRYFIVDIGQSFEQMAFRRNKGVPPYIFPAFINNKYPKPDTRYYEHHPTQGIKGGLFSLDGVHPSAIGQGLIAYEFMKVMLKAGISMPNEKGQVLDENRNIIEEQVPILNWEKIYEDDSLYQNALPLVSDLFKHDKLKQLVLKFSGFLAK